MADLTVTGEVVVNSEKAEAAFDRVGNKAGQMASKVQTEAGKAGNAIDGIGAGAEKGAERFTRAESRMREAIIKSTRELEMLGKTASQKFEANLEFKGLDRAKFEPFLADLRKAEQATKQVESGLVGMGNAAALAGRAFAAIGVGVSVREFVKLADASTNVESRLRLVTASTAELTGVQQKLFSVAQASRVNFVDLVGTYAQVARSTKDLGVSQTALLGVIQTISQAVTISGGSAASAQAALTQLSQGFASGALRGEELNSILEQTPRLAQAVADGLGVSVGKLRELGQAGELTAEKVLGALQKSAAGVATEFGKMTVTVEQASTTAANSVLRLVGAFDKLSGATGVIAGSIAAIGKGIDSLSADVEKLGSQGLLRAAAQEVLRLDEYARNLRNGMKNGVFNPNAEAQLMRINAQLAEAKQRFRELDQQTNGAKDPRDQSGYTSRSQSYANEARRLEGIQSSMGKVLGGLAGVKDGFFKDLNALYAGYQAGLIKTAEYQAAVAKLIKEDGVSKAGGAGAKGGDPFASQREAAQEWAKYVEEFSKAAADATAKSEGLTKSQATLVEFLQSPAYQNASEPMREVALQGAYAAIAQEQLAEATKAQAKVSEEAARAHLKFIESFGKGASAAVQQAEQLRTEEAAAAIAADGYYSLAQAIELVTIARLQEQQQGLLGNEEAYLAVQKEIDARKELVGLIGSKEARKAAEDSAKDAAKEWERSARDIERALTDSLLRGFESGKGFAKNFVDTMKNLFSTLVLRPIISAVVSPVAGAITGALGLGGGAGGSIGGIANMASTANSAYNLYQGGLSGLTAPGSMYYNFATSSIGQGLGLSNAAPIIGNNVSAFAPAGTQLTGLGSGSGMGALGGAGAFAAVALAIGNILGAFRTETLNGSGLRGTLGNGKDLQPWEEWREGGTLLSGPEFSTMNPVEALTSARARLAELQASSAAGTLGNPQALATQQSIVDQLEKTYGSLAEATAKQSKLIQSAFDAMRDSAVDMATTLGLSTDKVKDFTTQLGGSEGLNFKDLKPEEIQAKITEALATANNELAQQLIGTWETTTSDISRVVSENIGGAGEDMMMVYSDLTESITKTRYIASEYAKDGEKAIDTLTRLANSLSTVNGIWDQLGNTMMDASLAGADAASRIVEAFGGLEAMTAATGSYFQNFYSEDERRDAVQRQLQGELDKIGLTLPDIDASNAREQYRALAEAQDRSTDAGLKAYVVLMQLSGGFASVTEAVQATTQTLEQQRESYYSSLQQAVSAQNKALQSQLDAAQEVAGTLESLFDLLHDNVRELYSEVDSSRGMQASQGNAFIDQALAAAKKSGYLPDADKLAEAIAGVRSGIGAGGYVSQFAEDRDRLVLAGKLSGLEKITEKQLTDAQRTVRALETQIDQGEQTLDFWRQQIDIATGTYEGVMSVEAAIQQLSGSLGGVTGKPSGANTVGGGSSPTSGSGAVAKANYGAEEALTSFDKFKAWYNGIRSNADASKFMDPGYEVPDWMRLHNGADDDTDKEQFGSYLFFKNNPQYAKDFEQIYATGRSSMSTDGSSLVKTDLSKLPKDIADYYRSNTAALLGTEGFGLDPVLAYQLYNFGPGQFGLDGKKQSFTEWLQNTKWTPDGLVSNNNVVSLAQMGYSNYNLARWETSSGNIIDTDGTLYTKEGKRLGMATQAQMDAVFGPGYKPTGGKPVDSGRDDYLRAIRANADDRINQGWSAQQLADALVSTGTSLSDIAAAYGISVDQVRENLINGGATNIPKFDVGTNYVPRDMLAYIHEGEAVVPKAYNPVAGGSAAGGNAELVAEVRALREAVAALQAAASQTADNTKLMPQMGRQFDQYSNGGQFSRQKALA